MTDHNILHLFIPGVSPHVSSNNLTLVLGQETSGVEALSLDERLQLIGVKLGLLLHNKDGETGVLDTLLDGWNEILVDGIRLLGAGSNGLMLEVRDWDV